MTLRELLSLPLSSVDYLRSQGQVTDRDYARYSALWEWSAPRWSGRAYVRQSRVYSRAGPAAVWRRIQAVRRLAAELAGTPGLCPPDLANGLAWFCRTDEV